MLKSIFGLHVVFSLVLGFLGFGPKAEAKGVSKPPIELPFYPAKIGETYTFDVNIVKQLTYSVEVRFYLAEPNKLLHFINKETAEDSRQIHEILGGGKFINNEWIEPGVPAQFRVKILLKEGGGVILDELVSHPKTMATYMGRYAVLVNKKLPAGVYTIYIEYLEGGGELAPLYAKIWFARAHHGK